MMSDFSSLIGKFRARKDGPHESSSGRVTKRPRDSLVCNQCRKSKLRCDRGQPCSNCVKRDDDEAVCTYERPTAAKFDISHYAAAEERLLHLESMVKYLMQNQAEPLYGSGLISAKPMVPPELPRDPVEAAHQSRNSQIDSTTYVGFTHWSAILDDIHELKVVLGSSAGVQELEDPMPSDAPDSGSELIFGSSNDYSLQQILSQYLPPKVEVDRFLSIYFQGETFIVPFIHTYHFQSQYREFWTDTASVNPLWLSMLFSICYMASLIKKATGSYQSSQNDSVAECSLLHTAAGQCLVLGEYHRPQQFAIEALAMYGHCKNLGRLDPSREAGAILGMVVRMAYEMGYHRDPDSFGSFTVFEGEMRRRLWAACKQMDLMISFQLGLPSNICLEDCDTKSPRNILDSDFDADTQVLPAPRSENEATRILWFIVKERQMVSFSKVCRDALSFKEKSEAEILQLDKEIRQMHTTIPDVLRPRPLSESIADASFIIMTRLYVEFIYLKSLCVLHRKYMARGNAFSTRSCVEAGKSLVSQFIDMYNEFAPGGQLHTERWMLTNYTMNDFLLGIMVLCLVVHSRWKRGSQNSAIDTATESEVLTLLEQSCAICIQESTANKDARRVSRAIRLTLNGAKSASTSKNATFQSSLTPPASSSNMQLLAGEVHACGPASQSPLWPGYAQGDETAFGPLDPLNFIGSDLDGIDWTAFDT